MGWSKTEKTSWGGNKKSHPEKGSLYGKGGKDIDKNNHVHFHKDGVTTTKNGRKTTIKKS